MIDLDDKQERGWLLKAVKTSRQAIVPFRRVRKEFVRDHSGSWYSESASAKARYKTIINPINQTANVMSAILAANNPRVMVSTTNPANWAFAKRFEVNLNKLISDMNLADTFQQIVMDAFFMIGCAVVTMRDTDTRFHGLLESEEDVMFDPGEPWLNRVSIDRLILDMSAEELTKMRYCGHIYRADYRKIQDEPGYKKSVVKRITPTKRDSIDNPAAARDMASGEAEDDELKPMVWLMNLWIPENHSVATFALDQDLPPLIERPWTGSQAGPYKFLSLGPVPDNVIPCSPCANLKALHDLRNRIYRKMEKQSDSQRTVNAYAPGGEADAKELQNAKDGQWVKIRNPQDIAQLKLGGIDAGNQAWSISLAEDFNQFAGNIRGKAGLGPGAPTLGQEEIMSAASSAIDAQMHLAVWKFASQCIGDLGYLMWNDETLEIQSSVEVEGTPFKVDSSWPLTDAFGNRVRYGEFEELNLVIEACSMRYKSAEEKLQDLFSVLDRIAPLWPMFQASGASLEVQELLSIIANLLGRPELLRIITFATPAQELGGDQNTIRQSPVTRRETVRRSVPTGGTNEARGAILAQALAGGRSQNNPAQMGSLMRPSA